MGQITHPATLGQGSSRDGIQNYDLQILPLIYLRFGGQGQ